MNSLETKTAVSKILIVDDHAETRRLTRFFLRDLRFEFEECADGADALDCYEAFRPDWILMDWEMKRMNGLTATRRIVEAHPKARILMVTQYDDEELRQAAAEAGASGFVLKDDLLSLRSLLKEAQTH
jgi:two-component system response regulator DegU